MRTPLLLLAAALLAGACGGRSEESAVGTAADRAAEIVAVEPLSGPPAAPAAAQAPAASPVAADSAGLMIVRTGTLRLRVGDYAGARAQVDRLLKGYDAYVASENETRGYGGLEGQLTVRVAARQFEPLVDHLVGLAREVAYKEITAEDVTEQYVDAAARLRSKKAVEQRYLELLAQARTVQDILNVENNLRVIREEIESTEGRLRFLQNRVRYSTLHLTLFTGEGAMAGDGPFWRRLADAFADGWGGFVGLLLGLVQLWPLWLLLFGAGLPLRRWWRRRRARPRT